LSSISYSSHFLSKVECNLGQDIDDQAVSFLLWVRIIILQGHSDGIGFGDCVLSGLHVDLRPRDVNKSFGVA
jgi:hypothetical protein